VLFHSDDVLAGLGWDENLDTSFAPYAARGAEAGRVVRVDRGSLAVTTAGGEARLPLAGRLLDDPPEGGVTVGDWVAVEAGMVTAVLPRRTVFRRKVAGSVSAAQAVAANIDVALVVTPLGDGVNTRRIERSLALVWSSGARPVVLLTKADLSDDLPRDLALAQAAAAAAPVLALSAVDGWGVEHLPDVLMPGVTAVLLGPSGAGKSTLVNLLRGEDLLATAAVRDDGRGRHTTTHRQLVPLPGGALLVDTPGMRELALWDSDGGLATQFADIVELAAECRFSDCEHRSEPGCAVRAAIERDASLGGRLQSWRKLEREQRKLDARVAGYVRAERHRAIRTFSRSVRARPDKRTGW
jgi:ribosome biogenesis GTPase